MLTDVLPTALQHIAEFIPAYELLTIIRGTIFNSFSNEYIFGLTKLIIYAPLFFIVGLILINYSIRYIKKTGKGYILNDYWLN